MGVAVHLSVSQDMDFEMVKICLILPWPKARPPEKFFCGSAHAI